ncbi:MAG: SsrA-binding protein SmpB [Candidatus Saccharimonadales bacterium]
MSKKKAPPKNNISNRRVLHDYSVRDDLLVGIELTGGEAKALRMGHGQLRGSYVTIKNDELWLLNAVIIGDGSIPIPEEQQTRSRKLLAKRKEIEGFIAAKQQGQTIIPLEILTRGRYIKVRIAVARGKKNYDKRQSIKERDETRATAVALKYQ